MIDSSRMSNKLRGLHTLVNLCTILVLLPQIMHLTEVACSRHKINQIDRRPRVAADPDPSPWNSSVNSGKLVTTHHQVLVRSSSAYPRLLGEVAVVSARTLELTHIEIALVFFA